MTLTEKNVVAIRFKKKSLPLFKSNKTTLNMLKKKIQMAYFV